MKMNTYKKIHKTATVNPVKMYSPIKAVMESGDSWRYHSAVRSVSVHTSIALRDPTIDSPDGALMRMYEKGQLPRIESGY
jgi:hypothetical protein